MKPLETITGTCSCCNQYSTFKGIGTQYDLDNNPHPLYNCGNCHTTKSLDSVIKYSVMLAYITSKVV